MARVCERCGRDWQRIVASRWCSDCRADLTDALARERHAQERHGHTWDLADVIRAVERWADERQ